MKLSSREGTRTDTVKRVKLLIVVGCTCKNNIKVSILINSTFFVNLLPYVLEYPNNIVHSQKKRYKSCHWGCTFSKGTLLSILGANMYILGANKYMLCVNMYILGVNMYILGANKYILCVNMYILGANYILCVNMYISEANMSILGPNVGTNMYILGANMYH